VLVFLTIKGTTMNFRKIAFSCATIAALAPAICNATSERDALNACARAFASSLAAPGAAAPAFKVSYQGDQYSGSTLAFYSKEYTFELHAKDPKTGLPIGRASCSTDAHGSVIALSLIPSGH
jgi:hypothetical protein